jgi:hypothetical protein
MYYGSNMFGKKEFGVVYETEITDVRIPRGDSVLLAQLLCDGAGVENSFRLLGELTFPFV